jgi:hypothetical protein
MRSFVMVLYLIGLPNFMTASIKGGVARKALFVNGRWKNCAGKLNQYQLFGSVLN